ncbi:MAG: cytochrome c [Methylococcaceae bacterium]|nr:cytochrome c [Methylococcaceae bacterium]
MTRKSLLILSLAATPVLAGNWNVPIVARSLDNPVPINDETIRNAADLYSRQCVSCHGREGRGDGTEEKVDYSLQSILATPTQPGNQPLTDGELYWKITHGVGKMPSFAGKLTDEERWLMVNHMRRLPPDPK